jgi:protein TonB
MKTKNNPRFMANLNLFLVLPVVFLVLIALCSCATKKKVATVQTVSKEKTMTSDQDEPFVVVEEMPMFPGGDSTLLTYISQNTKYPESSKTNKIEGKVIVRFCVTALGIIDRISVLRGVNPELDAEAVRVVSSIPAFKPGKQGGKPVPVWYMVPVEFSLK